MKKHMGWVYFLWLVAFLLTLSVSGQQRPTKFHLPSSQKAFHPHRLLIKPKAMVPGAKAKVAVLHTIQGGKILKSFAGVGGLQVVEFPTNVDVALLARKYATDPSVAYAELDYKVHISATPNDPLYANGTLWGLQNAGQDDGLAAADIHALEGWNIRTDATNVIVAIIDTGVRYTHEDLAANMWTNPGEISGNGLDDDGDGIADDIHGINTINGSGDPWDDEGHGTHVAGIIGAVGNNATGVTGVAWKVKIMACKFIDESGYGYFSDAVTCIDYARVHGANVMNLSWGGYDESQALADAIEAARQAGIIVVAAAGNYFNDNDANSFYPASYPHDNIISVATTTRTDDLAYFSDYGQSTVDLGAPGQDITSTWSSSDAAYTNLSGTSMAAPYVAGLVALMKAQFPGDSYLQLLNRIFASTDPLAALSNRCRTGGRINLAKALSSTSSAPGNDNFAHRRAFSGYGNIEGINTDATREPGEPNHAGSTNSHSIWWSWTPSSASLATLSISRSAFLPVFAVYTGTNVSNLTLITNSNPSAGSSNLINFSAEAGTEYQIAVDSADGLTGSTVLNLTSIDRPRNDNFTNHDMIIHSTDSSFTSSNTLATAEPGEPRPLPNMGGHSVWFSWTPPLSGGVTVSTLGSTFDTVLAVYTGDTLSNLTLIASNDNDPAGGTSSRVTFNVTGGTEYQIQIDGAGDATGSFQLNIPPDNDLFADRVHLTGSSVSATGANILATKEPSEPDHAGKTGGKSLWWSWTAPTTGVFTIQTLGSTFDTLLAIYTGDSMSTLVPVAANDDRIFGDHTSLINFNATAGMTYQIAVDGVNGAYGTVQLHIGNDGYIINSMGTLPGYNSSVVYGLNSSGATVGVLMNSPNYSPRAVIWTTPSNPQFLFGEGIESTATCINDHNQVVGYFTKNGTYITPFLWQGGVITEFNAIGDTAFGEATAIDNAGHVVGWMESADFSIHAFYWENGVTKDLGSIGTDRTTAYGLNGPGFICGGSGTFNAGPGPAALWQNFQLSYLNIPGAEKDANCFAVNTFFQMVGEYTANGYRHAFIWDKGNIQDIGTPNRDTSAIAINNLGQVVGDEGDSIALLWENGHSTNLFDQLAANAGWSALWMNYAINDHGQIGGAGQLNGQTSGYLLTPLKTVTPRPYLQTPVDRQVFLAGTDISLTPGFYPDSNTVSKVDYFLDTTLIGSSSNPPYTFLWTNAVVGDDLLTARVTSLTGNQATSPPVSISVVVPPLLKATAALSGHLALNWLGSTSLVWSLETATNVEPPVLWVPSTNPVTIDHGSNSATFAPTNRRQFFRVRATGTR